MPEKLARKGISKPVPSVIFQPQTVVATTVTTVSDPSEIVIDSVNQVVPEITLLGSLNGTQCQLTVDCGAGRSYWLRPKEVCSTVLLSPSRDLVRLADGSTVGILGEASVHLSVLSVSGSVVKSGPVCLRVIQSKGEESILIGRDILEEWRITCEGARACRIDGHLVYCRPTPATPGLSDFDIPRVCQLIDQQVVDEDERAHLQPEELEQADIPSVMNLCSPVVTSCLQSISSRDWTPMALAGSLSSRIRPKSVSDSVSNKNQTHICEVRFDGSFDTSRVDPMPGKLYMHKLYDRLQPEHKRMYHELVNGYLESGLWTSCAPSPDSGVYRLPGSQVFMVAKPNSKKGRLVVDARRSNELLGKTSNSEHRVITCLQAVRVAASCIPSDELVVVAGDLRSAFYGVHLQNLVVPLWVVPEDSSEGGVRELYTQRLAFGLTFGPCGLSATVSPVLSICRDSFQLSSFAVLQGYVDDISAMCSVGDLSSVLQVFSVFHCLGFSIQPEKLRIISTPAARTLLANIPVSDSATMFGCSMSLDDSDLRMSYATGDRLQNCRQLVGDVLQRGFTTRRATFAIAGMAGYDPLQLNPRLSFYADCLRVVAGRTCTFGANWDTSRPLDPVLRFLFAEILHFRPEEESSSRVGSSQTLSLSVETDASGAGWGFVIRCNDSIIHQQAGLWRAKERIWHSNRKELKCVHHALSALTELVDHLEQTRFKGTVFYNVEIRTDNRPTVAWLNNKGTMKGIERIAIIRLRASCLELCGHLREIGEGRLVRVTHLPGYSNELADNLSRLGYQQMPNGQLLHEAIHPEIPLARDWRSALDDELDDNSLNEPMDVVSLLSAVVEGRRDEIEPMPPDIKAVDNICRWHRSLHCAALFFDRCRWFLRAWRKKEPSDEYPHDVDESLLLEFAHVCRAGERQEGDDPNKVRIVADRDSQLERLLIMDAHRRARHQGAPATFAFVSNIVGVVPAAVKKYVRVCFRCQQLNARRRWCLGADIQERCCTAVPYSRISLDHLYLADKRWILCAACTDTGHLSLLAVSSLTGEETASALRQLELRFNTRITKIHCDSHPALKSPAFTKQLKGCQVTFSPAYAHYNNSVIERAHRKVLQCIRSAYDKSSERLSLDEIANVINSSPHGGASIEWSAEEGAMVLLPVTSQLLAFGYDLNVSSRKIIKRGKLPEFRDKYYSTVFAELRKRSERVMKRRRLNWTPRVGEWVLFYNERELQSKLSVKWMIARIIDIIESKITLERTGTRVTVGAKDLCPLRHTSQYEPRLLPSQVGRVMQTKPGVFDEIYRCTIVDDWPGAHVLGWTLVRWHPHNGLVWDREEFVSPESLSPDSGAC